MKKGIHCNLAGGMACVALLTLSACGGSSGGGGGGGSLAQQLSTRYVSTTDFDAWECTASGGNSSVGYAFINATEGSYLVLDASGTVTQIGDFDYVVNSGNSVLLTYDNNGAQEDISSISFSGADAWRGNSSTDGSLNCARSQFSG